MELPSRQNTPGNDVFYQYLARLVREVDSLKAQLEEARAKLNLSSPESMSKNTGLQSRITIPAAADPNAQAQVFGAGFSADVPTITISSSIGVSFGSSPGFVMSISNPSTFRSAIGAAAKASPALTAGTYSPVNSITVTAEGVISAIS